MPKFHVSAMVTISVLTIVEAADQAIAIAIADERGMQTLPTLATTGAHPDAEWCHGGELDGTPFQLTAEETTDD